MFGRLTGLLASVADQCCGGRIVLVTEGGYDLAALGGSLRAAIGALDELSSRASYPAPGGPSPRGDAAVAAARAHLRAFWAI
jgi:acetoin utilization deacetylase AcuC-like enzyme